MVWNGSCRYDDTSLYLIRDRIFAKCVDASIKGLDPEHSSLIATPEGQVDRRNA